MINDFEFEGLAKPVIEAYNQMQSELIFEIAKRLKTYDKVSGSLDWQINKLDELGALDQEAVKIISKYSKISEEQIHKLLKDAGYLATDMNNLQNLHSQGAFDKNPVEVSLDDILSLVKQETRDKFSVVNSKALESTKKAYIDSVNKAYIEVTSGVYDYSTAIKRATDEVAKRGITGATYMRDGKPIKYTIEAVVRRDIVTAINKAANLANEKLADELGANHYYISQHLGARNTGIKHQNHESWQGTVTQINGSSGEYPNHHKTTGDGLVDGLGGANCRHHKKPFWPGFSVIPPKLDKAENDKVTDLLTKQRYYERAIREYKRRKYNYKGLDDTDGVKRANSKIKEYQEKLTKLIEDNDDILKRQSSREQVVKKGENTVSEKDDIGAFANIAKKNHKTENLNKTNSGAFSLTKEQLKNNDTIEAEFNKSFSDKNVEYAVITDKVTDKVLTDYVGGKAHELHFSDEMIGILKSAEPKSINLFHLHPSNGTFSPEDLVTFNSSNVYDRWTIFTPKGTKYHLSSGEGKLSKKIAKNKDSFLEMCDTILKEIQTKNPEYSWNETQHELMVNITDVLGWKYERKK